jgi:ASPIC and UnbV/FG-GAP-like repeat
MPSRRLSPRLGVVVLMVLLSATPARPRSEESTQDSGPWFVDVTHKAGILYRHHPRQFDNQYAGIMQGYARLGSAVAVADYDGDGFEDIYVTDSCATCKNHLYHNNGNFTFTDVAEAAGVADGNDEDNASTAALWFDYNNDGRPDLLVVRFGYSILYENLGNGKFRDVTKIAGLHHYMNAIKAIAFDYDNDGYPDLFFGSYFQPTNIFHPDTPRFFPESFETANNGGGVTVFHNNRNGTFTDVTDRVGVRTTGWTLDLGDGDANNDGYEDLYVANDFGTDRFFLNNGNGTFTDKTATAIGFDTKKGMNVDWGDYDNDGFLDIYVTNIYDDYMKECAMLWHNMGDGTFADVSQEMGTCDTGWGWAAKFVDYDNDGWLDLYVMNGWVSAGKDNYVPDIFAMITRPNVDLADARNWPPIGNKSLSGYEKKRLFHNIGGQFFKEEAARHGLDSSKDGRGIAVADFDNDGRMDLFVTNADDTANLYRNVLPTGAHWVTFILQGTKSNRFAVGAQVRLTADGKTYLQYVNGGNGFASQSTTRVHFGLGSTATIDNIEVRWPSGLRQVFAGAEPDHFYKLVEGQSNRLQPWSPSR